MLFYGKYENDQRYICAYDEEKHGAPRMEDSCGKYSNKSVIMPDGTETTPARYSGTEDINDVFISWYDVKGELWPGETA